MTADHAPTAVDPAGPEPTAPAHAHHAPATFHAPDAPPAPDAGQALPLVLAALREVLGPGPRLDPDTELFEVPGFDSIGLAALVDGLETRLGAHLDDELITPDAFATPATIAKRLVGPTLRGEVS